MVKKSDGTIEGLPKTCPKCGTIYHVCTLRVSYAHGYSKGMGMCVSVKLRCMKCHPHKRGEWKDKYWQNKLLRSITSSDRDAVDDALIFLRDEWKHMPHYRELTPEEIRRRGSKDDLT